MPFFSVIIPLYNKEQYLENTLNSVFSQTFSDFAIIVVNDGSTDGSSEIVGQYNDPRIRFYSQENQGVSTARNFGISVAQSEYITFLDADDFWYPTFLEVMKQNIGDFANESVFSAAIEKQTLKGIFPAQYSIERTSNRQLVNYFTASLKETAICTSAAVFHKSVFEKAGNFDTEIKSGQDTDLWIRIGLLFPIVFDWQILARYVYDPNSLSKIKNLALTRIRFEKYTAAEKSNPDLKQFLDLNRWSIALQAKMIGKYQYFKTLCNAINWKNIQTSKRILIQLPTPILKFILTLKAKI